MNSFAAALHEAHCVREVRLFFVPRNGCIGIVSA